MGVQERIKEIEEEIARTQVNKATEYHLGVLKAKLAKLRRQLTAPKKTGGGGGFETRKSGDATVVMIGLPSVGKSTLLNAVTDAKSEIAHYAFTTLKCIPGIMRYKDAKIQVLDLPGIIEGAKDGKGRGREIISVARSADLLLMLVEASNPRQKEIIESELHGFGIRVNQDPPNVSISKLSKGGVTVHSTRKITKISENEIKAAMSEYRIFNANVVLHEDITIDQFIDVLEGNRAYVPGIYVLTKCDLVPQNRLPEGYIKISAEKGRGVEKLRRAIYEKLNLMHIYTKRKGEKADLEEALVVRRGTTVGDVCEKLHRDLKKNFRYALVWGKGAKYPGQRIGIDHVLQEGDIVQIVKR
ncbi:TGS domain-containing protein [Candidatus Micrarchaeota archaeon]|nr:TGS domain-containing protein [Candidatus Micrarchaeota archaeon]